MLSHQPVLSGLMYALILCPLKNRVKNKLASNVNKNKFHWPIFFSQLPQSSIYHKFSKILFKTCLYLPIKERLINARQLTAPFYWLSVCREIMPLSNNQAEQINHHQMHRIKPIKSLLNQFAFSSALPIIHQ